VRWVALKKAIKGVYRDVNCNHTFAIAAGLSYYFLMSLFPLLIFAAAALAFIPIPNLFDEVLGLMSRFIPQQSMGLVQEIVKNVMLPPRTGLLSFGFVVTIWAATGGFAAMIEALNIAYDVEETRPYWRVRVLALQLTLTIGALVIFSLALTLIGPRFGEWLNAHGKVGPYFAFVWPLIRWVMIFIAVVFAVEMLYFMAPNVKAKVPLHAAGCGVERGRVDHRFRTAGRLHTRLLELERDVWRVGERDRPDAVVLHFRAHVVAWSRDQQ
jgi:membrane protein